MHLPASWCSINTVTFSLVLRRNFRRNLRLIGEMLLVVTDKKSCRQLEHWQVLGLVTASSRGWWSNRKQQHKNVYMRRWPGWHEKLVQITMYYMQELLICRQRGSSCYHSVCNFIFYLFAAEIWQIKPWAPDWKEEEERTRRLSSVLIAALKQISCLITSLRHKSFLQVLCQLILNNPRSPAQVSPIQTTWTCPPLLTATKMKMEPSATGRKKISPSTSLHLLSSHQMRKSQRAPLSVWMLPWKCWWAALKNKNHLFCSFSSSLSFRWTVRREKGQRWFRRDRFNWRRKKKKTLLRRRSYRYVTKLFYCPSPSLSTCLSVCLSTCAGEAWTCWRERWQQWGVSTRDALTQNVSAAGSFATSAQHARLHDQRRPWQLQGLQGPDCRGQSR